MTTPEQLGIGVVAERRLRHFMARTFQSGSYARFDGSDGSSFP